MRAGSEQEADDRAQSGATAGPSGQKQKIVIPLGNRKLVCHVRTPSVLPSSVLEIIIQQMLTGCRQCPDLSAQVCDSLFWVERGFQSSRIREAACGIPTLCGIVPHVAGDEVHLLAAGPWLYI